MDQSVIDLLEAAEYEAYRGIYSVLGYRSTTSTKENLFINTTQNAFAEKAMLCWSYLFGSKTEQYHKNFQIEVRQVFSDKTIKAVDPRFKASDVYDRIVLSSGLNSTDFDSFKADMKGVRDDFLAHKNMSADATMPDLDVALEMFKALRDEIWEFTKVASLHYPQTESLKRLAQYYEHNANHMLENRFLKDFAASGICV